MKKSPDWNYRFEERIGIMTDGRRDPTAGETEIAMTEADESTKDERQPFSDLNSCPNSLRMAPDLPMPPWNGVDSP